MYEATKDNQVSLTQQMRTGVSVRGAMLGVGIMIIREKTKLP
ncbi:MAG: hypothetical protein ACYTEL_08470 [Planctomycetota bacterium]|jgi:hypothetical protein